MSRSDYGAGVGRWMSQPITLMALAAGVVAVALGVAGFMYLEKLSKHAEETKEAVEKSGETWP